MGTTRTIRRPVGRPQLVPHGSEIPDARTQLAAAERRLEATGRAPEARKLQARQAADKSLDDPEGIDRLIANQEEILRRLSAQESLLTKLVQRVESVTGHLDEIFDDEKEATSDEPVAEAAAGARAIAPVAPAVTPVTEIPTGKTEDKPAPPEKSGPSAPPEPEAS